MASYFVSCETELVLAERNHCRTKFESDVGGGDFSDLALNENSVYLPIVYVVLSGVTSYPCNDCGPHENWVKISGVRVLATMHTY